MRSGLTNFVDFGGPLPFGRVTPYRISTSEFALHERNMKNEISAEPAGFHIQLNLP